MRGRSNKASNSRIPELRLMEMLINKFIQKLEKNGFEPKVQDVLKAVQLKQKLAKTSEAEKMFWELIDELRSQELENSSSKSTDGKPGKKKERRHDKNR